MIIRFDRKKLYFWILIQWAIVGCCIFFSYMISASVDGVSLSDYFQTKGISTSLYVLVIVLLLLDGSFITGVKEYEVDEKGITLKRTLGKAKTVTWSEMAFIGPAYVGHGRFRHKSIMYSKKLPNPVDAAGKHYTVEERDVYEIQDSAEMRTALKKYCPAYTEEFEEVSLQSV